MSSSTDPGRRLLPLLPNHPLGRSAITCKYRCGDACAHEAPNTSGNAYFGDVVGEVVRRRGLLKAGAVLAVAGAGVGLVGAGSAVAKPDRDGDVDLGGGRRKDGLNFTAVAPNTEDRVVAPEGYEQGVVLRWGDPVVPGAPAFDFDRQTAAAQAKQFGYNCDFLGLVPAGGHDEWLLVANHEYTTEEFLFKDWDADNPTREQTEIAWAAHGMSVVRVERDRRSGRLEPKLDRRYNRRITAKSEFRVTGPAAGSSHLKTSADPTGTKVLGTLNNCAGGVTPWGTILSGEENFNQYFANAGSVTDPVVKARLARYGLSGAASTRKWERFDKRFDVAQEPNEVNRFGWVVEIDPLDPDSTPVKHTALGRFKHEGANVIIARDGRAVAYMGDDERFDYMYKFVSRKKYEEGDRRHNLTLLEEGDLYVARFTGDSPAEEIDGSGALPSDGEFDGTGRWIPLVENGESTIRGKDAAWVLTFTRLAADRLGKRLDDNGDPVLDADGSEIVDDPSKVPTKMDRPEDIQVNPVNGRVYAALTNNSRRGTEGQPGADEANPLTRSFAYAEGEDGGEASFAEQPGNNNGHVIEWEEKGTASGTEFSWRIFLLAGDPETPGTYFAGYDKTQVSAISCPDNLEFDPAGNLWISTDGNVLSTRNQEAGTTGLVGTNDGLFAVPTAGPERGHLKAFLTVPIGAECSGPMIPADGKSVFVSVQHPGETTGSTRETPSSTWPDRLATAPYPRPSVAVAFRYDGGRIGS